MPSSWPGHSNCNQKTTNDKKKSFTSTINYNNVKDRSGGEENKSSARNIQFTIVMVAFLFVCAFN